MKSCRTRPSIRCSTVFLAATAALAVVGVLSAAEAKKPAASAKAGKLYVGVATTSITPDQPVALDGHRNLRVSNKVESPVTANVLCLECRDGEKVLDQAVFVSCDIVAIRNGLREVIRAKVKPLAPDFDVNKLVVNATHTHNAPVTEEGRYTLPEKGNMKPAEYVEYMSDKVAAAVAESWKQRQPAKAGWAQGQAVIAQNRRALYADGKAKMYGNTNAADFRGIEGYEDHNLEMLCFWDQQDRLIATVINVPCPSQEAEGGLSIHADFWHPVREKLRELHGKDLCVLGWAGAGGDQTSRPMYGKAADERMRKLRGITRLEEVARRIVNGWEDAYQCACKDMRQHVVLRHCVEQIELPHRQVTEAEVAEARKEAAKFANDPAQLWNFRWNQGVVERYETQKAGKELPFTMELHVLRLGDVAIATNEFELYTDYGVRMKARSPAVQTFLIQLTGSGGYLPSQRAVDGGGYGAVIQSSRVGPEGGQSLVDRTVAVMKTLWPPAK
jgi:hypothetical protein